MVNESRPYRSWDFKLFMLKNKQGKIKGLQKIFKVKKKFKGLMRIECENFLLNSISLNF